jgi:hypothetical protein
MSTRQAEETTETMGSLAVIDDTPTAAAPARPLVEVVVPVHNEQRVLVASVTRLHRHLAASFPFAFRITMTKPIGGQHLAVISFDVDTA